MTKAGSRFAPGLAAGRWIFAAALAVAIVASGLFASLKNGAGLFYVLCGAAAACLMAFTGREIAAAFGHAAGRAGSAADLAKSARFWEAAARNAWVLGAMGSALNFTIALGIGSESIADIGNRMIGSFIVTLYGLIAAVICLVPAIRLSGRAASAGPAGPAPGPGRAVSPDRIAGYVLFAAVIVLTVLLLGGGQPQGGPLPIGRVLFHPAAILTVIGGTVALALFLGAGAQAWTYGFALTGLAGLFMGLIQALFGFVHKSIAEISSACAFIISASTLSLLGFAAVAGPLEDREILEGRRDRPSPLSRLFWAIFPLLTFIFLILTFLMVVTPMERTVK
ncbi:MAG TPA: hypothetical protein P5119_05805 [Candidatus Aminicenantes bacterium]|nr:hypothetical protein [Candidatus Aminicenantes bacterium]HRY64838.1 hypothetical protein [Candidatus Aminicenantes bacterium]HRZ71751.1 hypothetical protein [Candidatus Aminicenantes bacterium]